MIQHHQSQQAQNQQLHAVGMAGMGKRRVLDVNDANLQQNATSSASVNGMLPRDLSQQQQQQYGNAFTSGGASANSNLMAGDPNLYASLGNNNNNPYLSGGLGQSSVSGVVQMGAGAAGGGAYHADRLPRDYNDDFPSLYSTSSSTSGAAAGVGVAGMLGVSSSAGGGGSGGGYFMLNQQQQYLSQQQKGAMQLNRNLMESGTSGAARASAAGEYGVSHNANYGLSGLMNVIKSDNTDIQSLCLGVDLTSLGLDMNTNEPLYTMFSSPWIDSGSILRDPVFHLPECYPRAVPAYSEPVAAYRAGRFAEFKVETLLYAFYAMPQDVMQVLAARELYARGWKYHSDLKLWFTSQQQQQQQQGEDRQILYFDTSRWEYRVYGGGDIPPGFMSNEEISAAVEETMRRVDKGRGDEFGQQQQQQGNASSLSTSSQPGANGMSQGAGAQPISGYR